MKNFCHCVVVDHGPVRDSNCYVFFFLLLSLHSKKGESGLSWHVTDAERVAKGEKKKRKYQSTTHLNSLPKKVSLLGCARACYCYIVKAAQSNKSWPAKTTARLSSVSFGYVCVTLIHRAGSLRMFRYGCELQRSLIEMCFLLFCRPLKLLLTLP